MCAVHQTKPRVNLLISLVQPTKCTPMPNDSNDSFFFRLFTVQFLVNFFQFEFFFPPFKQRCHGHSCKPHNYHHFNDKLPMMNKTRCVLRTSHLASSHERWIFVLKPQIKQVLIKTKSRLFYIRRKKSIISDLVIYVKFIVYLFTLKSFLASNFVAQ